MVPLAGEKVPLPVVTQVILLKLAALNDDKADPVEQTAPALPEALTDFCIVIVFAPELAATAQGEVATAVIVICTLPANISAALGV